MSYGTQRRRQTEMHWRKAAGTIHTHKKKRSSACETEQRTRNKKRPNELANRQKNLINQKEGGKRKQCWKCGRNSVWVCVCVCV